MDAKENFKYHFHSILTKQYQLTLIVVPVGKVHCEDTEDEQPIE